MDDNDPSPSIADVKTIETPNPLPARASDLLDVALRDLQACEQDPRFHIDMGTWFSPNGDETCGVCLAGAVMAKSLGQGFSIALLPASFRDPAIERALLAINSFRVGYVTTGLLTLMAPRALERPYPPDRNIVEYSRNRPLFHRQIGTLIADLREMGL